MNNFRWAAIIPARSGSKRIKNKNMREFGSTTLVGRTILKALDSQLFDEVIISTDSIDIEQHAIGLGAKSYGLRPSSYSNDESSTIDVLLHLLSQTSLHHLTGFTLLQCTSPFTSLETIKQVTKLASDNYQSCLSVKAVTDIYLEWLLIKSALDSSSLVSPFNTSNEYVRSQDATRLFQPSGNAYAAQIKYFLENKSFANNPNSTFYCVSNPLEMIDIDTIEDFDKALSHLLDS